MIFSEDSRVKIPCILHLVRLGYQYLSLKNATWDEDTNIFPDIFRESIARLNPGVESDDIERLLDDVKLTNGLGIAAIGRTIHPYPTQAEVIKKLADAYNRTRLTRVVQKVLGGWLRWRRR